MNAMTTPHIQNLYKCSPRETRKFTVRIIRAGRVPFIRSSPGMGKSSIVHSIAEEFDLKLLDERLSTRSPVDLSGLPGFEGDGDQRRASFTPFENFPVESTPLPINPKTGQPYAGWLLFLDEFNSGTKAVQAAAYKLVLDRMTGLHKLHPNVVIVCAGNLSTDRAITNDLSTAMQSRLIHIEMEISFTDWLQDVAFAKSYDQRITGFLNWKNEYLLDFRPDHQEKTFCCPRTWEFMNDLLQDPDTGGPAPIVFDQDGCCEDIKLFAGTITSGVAAEFVNFTKEYANIPQLAAILSDPTGQPIPHEQGTKWAVVSHLMEKVTPTNFSKLSIYINRFSTDFRILFFRYILANFPQLKGTPEFGRAMSELSQYLYN
jgi:hypothetical protein